MRWTGEDKDWLNIFNINKIVKLLSRMSTTSSLDINLANSIE